MKIHRYYVRDMELTHDFWMQDDDLFHQWTRVLRYQVGREVVLFNDRQEVKMYKISKIGTDAAHLELVTELEPTLPARDVYVCFSLLKKDKNEWILQKGTELGVRHFIPLLTERTEKTGFDSERAEKIVIEAAEQCERADIPRIREPITLSAAIHEFKDKVQLLVAEQASPQSSIPNLQSKNSVAVFVGPEGGWTDEEKDLLFEYCERLSISQFTLRAETAAITAAALLQL